jgi:hypothetical protein
MFNIEPAFKEMSGLTKSHPFFRESDHLSAGPEGVGHGGPLLPANTSPQLPVVLCAW